MFLYKVVLPTTGLTFIIHVSLQFSWIVVKGDHSDIDICMKLTLARTAKYIVVV